MIKAAVFFLESIEIVRVSIVRTQMQRTCSHLAKHKTLNTRGQEGQQNNYGLQVCSCRNSQVSLLSGGSEGSQPGRRRNNPTLANRQLGLK